MMLANDCYRSPMCAMKVMTVGPIKHLNVFSHCPLLSHGSGMMVSRAIAHRQWRHLKDLQHQGQAMQYVLNTPDTVSYGTA